MYLMQMVLDAIAPVVPVYFSEVNKQVFKRFCCEVSSSIEFVTLKDAIEKYKIKW